GRNRSGRIAPKGNLMPHAFDSKPADGPFDAPAGHMTAASPEESRPAGVSDRGEIAADAIAKKGKGEALPHDVKGQFGDAYGTDLSGVQVHTDEKSATAAEESKSEAFTYGKDIFFGPGRYNPGSPHGKFVL